MIDVVLSNLLECKLKNTSKTGLVMYLLVVWWLSLPDSKYKHCLSCHARQNVSNETPRTWLFTQRALQNLLQSLTSRFMNNNNKTTIHVKKAERRRLAELIDCSGILSYSTLFPGHFTLCPYDNFLDIFYVRVSNSHTHSLWDDLVLNFEPYTRAAYNTL